MIVADDDGDDRRCTMVGGSLLRSSGRFFDRFFGFITPVDFLTGGGLFVLFGFVDVTSSSRHEGSSSHEGSSEHVTTSSYASVVIVIFLVILLGFPAVLFDFPVFLLAFSVGLLVILGFSDFADSLVVFFVFFLVVVSSIKVVSSKQVVSSVLEVSSVDAGSSVLAVSSFELVSSVDDLSSVSWDSSDCSAVVSVVVEDLVTLVILVTLVVMTLATVEFVTGKLGYVFSIGDQRLVVGIGVVNLIL